MDVDVSIAKDFITIGGVLVTCAWSVAKIRSSIDSVKVTAEKTSALLGKDIQHLTLAINEFKTELIHVKQEQNAIDRRLNRLEVVHDLNHSGGGEK